MTVTGDVPAWVPIQPAVPARQRECTACDAHTAKAKTPLDVPCALRAEGPGAPLGLWGDGKIPNPAAGRELPPGSPCAASTGSCQGLLRFGKLAVFPHAPGSNPLQ